MLVTCKFDEVRDIQEHVPSLAIDVNMAIESNVVPSTGTTFEFNGYDDFDQFGGRASDAFEVIDAQKNVLNRGKIVQSSPQSAPAENTSADAKPE